MAIYTIVNYIWNVVRSQLKKRILIIDDDEIMQLMLRKRLVANGFECVSVFSVPAALKQLAALRPDIILLDLEFHKVDGTAFLQHVRDWLPPDYVVPPVVVISGHHDKEIVDYVLNEGAVGFLSKPFEAEELVSMIQDYL